MVNAVVVETSLPEDEWKTVIDIPSGAGCICWFQISCLNFDPAKAALRVTFDGADKPQIDAPFESFFCFRRAEAPFATSRFWQSSIGTFEGKEGQFGAVSLHKMPFGCGFKVEIKGAEITSSDFYMTVRWTNTMPPELEGHRLYVRDIIADVDEWGALTLLDQPGGAMMLGLLMDWEGSTPDPSYLEGNLYVYTGEPTPTCFSNGQEDLFGECFYVAGGPVQRDSCGFIFDGGSIKTAYAFWPIGEGPCHDERLKVTAINGDPGKYETGVTSIRATPFVYCRYPMRDVTPPLGMTLSLDASEVA